jgi:ribosomal protein S18 acetylase RimI-like enzyme
MQSLAQRIWSPASHCHVGDLAWQHNQHLDRTWPTRLWWDGDEVVAWGRLDGPGELTLLVDPVYPADEVLAWFAGVATGPRSVEVLDRETHVIEALTRAGYVRDDGPYHASYRSRLLADLPDPVLPKGFTAHPSEDVERRVAVHRAAWHPSRVSVASYRHVMAAWPYRRDLDWVVEAPDGRYVANCLVWLDERNGVGELEPVGTDPRFRRLGLASAVCLAAMHALRDAGAQQAIVYPVANHPGGALHLYERLGFTQYARTIRFTAPAA